MLSCKEISKLVSESLDRKLPLPLRMEVRLHLMMCHLCRTYRKQSLLLRKLLRLHDASLTETPTSEMFLPEGASTRIKKALTKASDQA